MPVRPLLLGHRGARAVRSIPENTFASFDRALTDGCDGFEFDVRLTSDGVPVVCHDPGFKNIEIARATAQQCSEFPRLEEVLAQYASRAFLDIELKVEGAEKILTKLLKKFPPQRAVVSSFLPSALHTFHRQAAGIPLGLICEKKQELLRCRQLPIEYVIPQRKLVNRGLIREWKSAGKKILVWTVNDSEEMRHFRDWGVDGIISDSPKLLSQTLSS